MASRDGSSLKSVMRTTRGGEALARDLHVDRAPRYLIRERTSSKTFKPDATARVIIGHLAARPFFIADPGLRVGNTSVHAACLRPNTLSRKFSPD